MQKAFNHTLCLILNRNCSASKVINIAVTSATISTDTTCFSQCSLRTRICSILKINITTCKIEIRSISKNIIIHIYRLINLVKCAIKKYLLM